MHESKLKVNNVVLAVKNGTKSIFIEASVLLNAIRHFLLHKCKRR